MINVHNITAESSSDDECEEEEEEAADITPTAREQAIPATIRGEQPARIEQTAREQAAREQAIEEKRKTLNPRKLLQCLLRIGQARWRTGGGGSHAAVLAGGKAMSRPHGAHRKNIKTHPTKRDM